MDWYPYDPFAHITQEEATVGALRRNAADHDVTIRSMDQGRSEKSVGISLEEMSKKATA